VRTSQQSNPLWCGGLPELLGAHEVYPTHSIIPVVPINRLLVSFVRYTSSMPLLVAPVCGPIPFLRPLADPKFSESESFRHVNVQSTMCPSTQVVPFPSCPTGTHETATRNRLIVFQKPRSTSRQRACRFHTGSSNHSGGQACLTFPTLPSGKLFSLHIPVIL
jgi:hypothetical protein